MDTLGHTPEFVELTLSSLRHKQDSIIDRSAVAVMKESKVVGQDISSMLSHL